MKFALLITLLLTTLTSMASSINMQVEGSGQIRHGFRLSMNPTFTSFKDEVKSEIRKRMNAEFVSQYPDVTLNYSYELIRETTYKLFPKGIISAELIFPSLNEKKSIRFVCAFSVNDGGNTTLKKSCAKKLAKKVHRALNAQTSDKNE